MPSGIPGGQSGPSIYQATNIHQPHTHIEIDVSVFDRQSGTVKWFNDEEGYGFITPENHSLIIHHQNLHPPTHHQNERLCI
jgi:hypothetical protein